MDKINKNNCNATEICCEMQKKFADCYLKLKNGTKLH